MAEKDFMTVFEEFMENCPWRYEDYKTPLPDDFDVDTIYKCQAIERECSTENCAIFSICCAFSIDFD